MRFLPRHAPHHRALPRRPVGLLAGLTLAVAVSLALAAPALADGAGVTADATGGSLSESTSAAPSVAITLDGTDQTKTYSIPITVTDATGTGGGWNLTITSTQLATSGGAHTFPTDATTITGVSAACTDGNTCTDPTNSVSFPLTVPADTVAPTAVEFYNAAADSGLGSFTVTPTLHLQVPANLYAGTYTSTITLAIVTGP